MLTMAKNEGRMLRRWADYYGRQIGYENLLVLDDESDDGSTAGLPCRVHPLPDVDGLSFERRRMLVVNAAAAALLGSHDWVGFCDVDEFLVADPTRYDGLADLLSQRSGVPALGGHALNVLQVPNHEPAIDPERPVLSQRRCAVFVPSMCKPTFKSQDVPWGLASHGIRAPFEIDRDLFLIHLKFHDLDELRLRGSLRHGGYLGRGPGRKSTWNLSAEELAGLVLDAARGVDPARVEDFEPPSPRLTAVRRGDSAWFKSPNGSQLKTMRERDIVGIPERLAGSV